MTAQYRVGIDVGGTFTDIFVFDDETGRVHTHKVSSTPQDPHRAPISGLREILEKIGARGEQVSFVGLGTTVATNTLLEGKGARTGMVTTHGFRDLLEIARQTRPHLYDPFAQKPKLLVARHLRREVGERMAADGMPVTALDEQGLAEVVRYFRAQQVEAIAVCFLNAYANPAHEAQAVAWIHREWPEVHVVSSHQVMPEFREYERFMSTVVNASLMPSMRDYFLAFEQAVTALGITVAPVVMSSAGGVFTPALAGLRPIDTLFSGPSGGVSGAAFLGGIAGFADIITFDMGGTSTEVCLVRGGKPQLTHARSIKGYPIRTTSHDIHTIGAGGSSISSVDAGAMLQVGPESAGAHPGPACYSGGGAHATVTDANVVLGRLNQQHLLAGSLKIDARKSLHAIERDIGRPKNIDGASAALAVIELAQANMAQALRVVSVERGLEPGDFTLVALGGAGPLHAASVARQVGMAGVLVPPHPGVLCAMGVLVKDMQFDHSCTRIIDCAAGEACAVADGAYADLERRAREDLALLPQAGHARIERSAAVRYRGQNHEISVAVPEGAFDAAALATVAARFNDAHHELYGYRFENNPVEIVTLRLTAVRPVERPHLQRADAPRGAALPAPVDWRTAIFEDGVPQACPVYLRESLPVGHVLGGPAIIEQMDTTTVLPPGFSAVVDPWRNLFITWPKDIEP